MAEEKVRMLILGITGMLGNTLFRYCNLLDNYRVLGTLRNKLAYKKFSISHRDSIYYLDNPNDEDLLTKLIESHKPDVVINCIGIIKQILSETDPVNTININSLLPHKIYKICDKKNIRFIHISTDCVFSGNKGNYKEIDIADSTDLYGRSKLLGEQQNNKALTIRTSIIGHELFTSHSLLEWFLKQENEIYGYDNAIFSGFPTIEISKILDEFIIPNKNLSGVYHIASNPISKFELLKLISEIYKKKINIIKNNSIKIDRSLNANKFMQETGFYPKEWLDYIKSMHQFG